MIEQIIVAAIVALVSAAIGSVVTSAVHKVRLNGMRDEIATLREFRHSIAGEHMALWHDFLKREGKA